MISDVAAGAFLVAVIYLLVRPGSKGTGFVQAFGLAFAAMVSQVTDIAGAASDDRGESADDNTDDNSDNGN